MNVARAGQLLALAVFLATSVLVFVWLYGLTGARVSVSTPYTVSAVVPDAFALEPGAEVRAAGVRVGRVRAVDPRAAATAVTLELDREHAPIPRDTRVLLRTRTLVGENYVALTLGDHAKGTIGSTGWLPASAADESVQVDQVLETLSRPTRRELAQTLRSLGRATADRGVALNRSLTNLAATTRHGAPLAATLARHDELVATTLAAGGDVLAALGERGTALRRLIRDARRTAEAAGARDRELRRTLRVLPGALTTLRHSARALGGLGRTGTPVVRDLRAALRRLTPAVRRLAPAARDGTRLTRRLPALAAALEPLAARLERFARRAQPVAEPLRDLLAEAGPLAAALAPYSREVAGILANLGAAADVYDATGHTLRVQVLLDEQTALGPLPPELETLLDRAKGAGPLTTLGATAVDVYPPPQG